MTPSVPFSTYPHEITMYGSIPKTGRVIALWSLAMAVFLWALDLVLPHDLILADLPNTTFEISRFWILLVHCLCVGYWGWILIGMVCLNRFRRRWTQLSDARARYDQSGIYAFLGWPELLLSIFVAIPAASLLGLFTAETALSIPMPFVVSNQRLSLPLCFVLSFSLALGTFTLDYFRVHLLASHIRAETSQRQTVQTQLLLLQAQLEPHMLFNTLSNLHALIETDPNRAQNMLSRLIAFLRGTLNASQRSSHTLAQEFEYASDYLSLMQIRMGPRLQVVIDLPIELGDIKIPPMLLQPLLENAIQHGLEPTSKGGMLSLNAHQEGTMLILSVIDTGRGIKVPEKTQEVYSSGSNHPKQSGFGLTFVRNRIKTIYGDAAQLDIGPSMIGTGTQALLRLPMKWDLTTLETYLKNAVTVGKASSNKTIFQ